MALIPFGDQGIFDRRPYEAREAHFDFWLNLAEYA